MPELRADPYACGRADETGVVRYRGEEGWIMSAERILFPVREYVLQSSLALHDLRECLPLLREWTAGNEEAKRTLDALDRRLTFAEIAHDEAGGGMP